MKTLILASQSPRRRELLEKAGFVFHTVSMEISEILNETLSLDEALMELARRKASAIIESGKLLKFQNILVLAADTVVILDGQVIGKPTDIQDAERKLGLLSGRTHVVKTAICLWDVDANKPITALENSKVTFGSLTPDNIEKYVRECRPLDKAGAYGVQDVPKNFIERVDGAVDNVMGLPVHLVERLLEKHGWLVHKKAI